MESERFGSCYVVRLDTGEEIESVLTEFLDRDVIHAGCFIAFGAFQRVQLSFFNVATREYRHTDIDRQVEVVSLMGNIARIDGEPTVYMHAIVTDEQAQIYSGRLTEGIVRPTLEIFVNSFLGELRRERDAETGLELLALRQLVASR